MAAELLKPTGEKTRRIIAKTCTDIMRGSQIKVSWTKNTITVLHKAGETCDAQNYRRICTLDITYKVMTIILYNRIIVKINEAQSVDQAGFIKGFSCDDHLITCALLIEKLWRQTRQLWVCVVDYKKAFDSAEFFAIWND